jgi:hypothetical protein
LFLCLLWNTILHITNRVRIKTYYISLFLIINTTTKNKNKNLDKHTVSRSPHGKRIEWVSLDKGRTFNKFSRTVSREVWQAITWSRYMFEGLTTDFWNLYGCPRLQLMEYLYIQLMTIRKFTYKFLNNLLSLFNYINLAKTIEIPWTVLDWHIIFSLSFIFINYGE